MKSRADFPTDASWRRYNAQLAARALHVPAIVRTPAPTARPVTPDPAPAAPVPLPTWRSALGAALALPGGGNRAYSPHKRKVRAVRDALGRVPGLVATDAVPYLPDAALLAFAQWVLDTLPAE